MKDKITVVKMIFGLFAALGIIFIIVGILWFAIGSRFKKSAVEVSAVIQEIEQYRDSDGDLSHRVYVSYSYNEQNYENVRLNEYSSNMYEGKEIEIMIDPNNPRVNMMNLGLYLGSGIFIGMGVIFACVGIFPLIGLGRSSSVQKKLIASGQYIYATVESIQYNKNYTMNGQYPFIIYCTYKDDYKNIIYRFKSDNIWTNPEYFVQPGSEIKVFVDRQNYKNYHVDIESIMQAKIMDYT